MVKSFCKTLKKMLKDEEKADQEYLELAEKIKHRKAKLVLQSIATDERRHYRKLKRLQNEYCKK